MATATPTKIPFNSAETQRKLRHPLHSLRGYIRTYVVFEGLAVALMFVGLIFWAALIFDFGLFSTYWTMFDWIKVLDQNFGTAPGFILRLMFLAFVGVCLVGVVVWWVLRRLFSEFSDESLALVLERRFPDQLGDRLITAVEMAQPGLAEKYGFSQEMIDYTIRSAAQSVESVPVSKVFNWRRLCGQWIFALGSTFGIWAGALAGISVLTVVANSWTNITRWVGVSQSAPVNVGWSIGQFHGAGWIMLKRDFLLQNRVYWPTRSYVEIVRFQDSAEHPGVMKIGRDETNRPTMEARAFRWVIYDAKAPESIRPMRFGDLKGWVAAADLDIDLPDDWGGWVMDIDDLHPDVPASLIPKDWKSAKVQARAVHDDLHDNKNLVQTFENAGVYQHVKDWLNWRTWTMDRLEHQLARTKEVFLPLQEQHFQASKKLHRIIGEHLEVLTKQSWTNWNIRKLKIPDKVYVYYRGRTTKSSNTADWDVENRYYIGLNKLKESVRFWVRGENFQTPAKEIILVPPPSFQQLLLTKREPAYIYYRIQGDQMKMKGKKQSTEVPVSLTGPISRISVPLGTDIKLFAVADRKLNKGISIGTAETAKYKNAEVPDVQVKLQKDKKTFWIALDNVRQIYEFAFRFNDLDKVKGYRHVLIEPVADRAPQEVTGFELAGPLRKPQIKGAESTTAGGLMDAYLVTADARIPFKGEMKDDYGLTKVEWVFDYDAVAFELIGEEDITGGKGKKTSPPLLSASMRRSSAIASGFHNLPAGFGQQVFAPIYWTLMKRYVETDIKLTKGREGSGRVMMSYFRRKLSQLKGELPWNEFLNQLKMGERRRQILPKIHSVNDEIGFDVRDYLAKKIKSADPKKQAQLHYRMRLFISATDNNVEIGPPQGATTLSKLPITFLIVTETELLAQILIEEEILRNQLQKAVDKLRNAKTTLNEQLAKLRSPNPALFTMDDRVKDDVLEPVQEKLTVAEEVLAAFVRIRDEMGINRVTPERIDQIKKKIIAPLKEITQPGDGEFVNAEAAVSLLLKGINDDLATMKTEKDKVKLNNLLEANRKIHITHAQDSIAKMDRLIVRIDEVLEAIGGGIEWDTVVTAATQLERDQRKNIVRELSDVHRKILEYLLGGL